MTTDTTLEAGSQQQHPQPQSRSQYFVPPGYVGLDRAAQILNMDPKDITRRWLRANGVPALQLRRGWPPVFVEKVLIEWYAKKLQPLKPEKKYQRKKRKASSSGGARSRASASAAES
jgi:hypothetical protein